MSIDADMRSQLCETARKLAVARPPRRALLEAIVRRKLVVDGFHNHESSNVGMGASSVNQLNRNSTSE